MRSAKEAAMKGDIVSVPPPGAKPLRRSSRARDRCAGSVLARVLTALLLRPVTSEEVQERSVGFGLARPPQSGEELFLTTKAASRLFLAAYQLPSQATIGTWLSLLDLLRARCLVFVPLTAARRVVQVHGVAADNSPAPDVVISEAEVAHLPLDRFAVDWDTAGRLLLAAAPRWLDLPRQARTFFGGTRNRDGTYFWHTADCDTDVFGNVMRY